mmetsp:Transcript_5205/g.14754  ORF Transcript_5205/g.14754 Transcript_5205/m.14754 type:complete len:483 (+) Transcript_5205:107-1555(+)|eukprot:CAMPEP_0181058156 /NCGR_PEP_ID=MMETSP1070-20121207/20651_1 /TAXON_ID=265543 /ORGANISM="Minutocellus polymorphus, Strain NH13" /LENGTH=482 /DNA_ID=CAMNT_0023137653 /DNA_START=79 /DNA_END=1527 /DNA_ORIENTATION=+
MKRALSRGLVAARSSHITSCAAIRLRSQSSSSSSAITRTPEPRHVPATVPIDFDVASRVAGQESQTLEVQLSPGQVLRAESGAMLFMTQGVKMETTLGADGVSAGFKRMLTGQNMFISDYTYEGPEGTAGTVGLGTDFPSKIIRLDLEEYGGKIVCQKSAYLAGSDTVDIEMAFTKSLTSGFFGGEGFVLQSLTGTGDVFVKAGGTLVRRDLKEGESLRVSSGSLVAMTQTIDFDVSMMPGIKNAMFGGEGLFITTLTGPGTVWLQGMPADRMISAIAQRVPAGGGIGLGVPLGIGGGGGGEAGADGAAVAGADEAAAGAVDIGAEADGAEDTVAATDAAVDADRQATVASSGLYDDQSSTIDSDSPSALFGDAAPQDEASAPSSPSSPGFEDEPPSSAFSSDDSSVDFGEDATQQQFDDFADETQFSTDDQPTNDDFGMDESSEEFDAGESFGGDDDGGGGDDEGIGRVLRSIWDFFNDDE